jgi:hypothetical protein
MLGLKISLVVLNITVDTLNQLDGAIKACVDALTFPVFEADVLALCWLHLDGLNGQCLLLGSYRRDDFCKQQRRPPMTVEIWSGPLPRWLFVPPLPSPWTFSVFILGMVL